MSLLVFVGIVLMLLPLSFISWKSAKAGDYFSALYPGNPASDSYDVSVGKKKLPTLVTFLGAFGIPFIILGEWDLFVSSATSGQIEDMTFVFVAVIFGLINLSLLLTSLRK